MEDQILLARKRLFTSGSMFLLVLSLVGLAYFVNLIKENRYVGQAGTVSTIVVSGKGEVVAIPDIATFSYLVREEAKTAAEAQQLAVRKINDLKLFLKEKKVEDRDIKTTEYTISPKYEYKYTNTCVGGFCPGNQVVTGYYVMERVEVKVRNLDDAGAILAGIGQKNVSEISGLNFGVDDIKSVQADARAKAIEDAKEQAEKLADSLDASIVRVISFNEEGNSPRVYQASMMMKSDAGMGGAIPEVSPGENKITSSVTVTYEIR